MNKIVGCGLFLFATAAATAETPWPAGLRMTDVYYQVLVRSFADSNGDGIGDLNGLRSQLDYLQDLGVTALWINPIVPSAAYHNYFADDFTSIDPAYGTMEDFRALLQDLHRRGMKLLLDMETQYVGGKHPWYTEAVGKPSSPLASYLLWRDAGHTQPEGGYMGLTEGRGWDKQPYKIMTVNLNNPAVLAAEKAIYRFWLDPNGDGDLTDGVDGFRIDHCMDDLDDKHLATHLLGDFWKPIVQACRQLRPDVVFLAEQSNWGDLGTDILRWADMDAVFNIPLRMMLTGLGRPGILQGETTTAQALPGGKVGFTHLENHDVTRVATMLGGSIPKLKLAAALLMTSVGLPVLYYGQELGMKGEKLKGGSDGNDIPMREAFPWTADLTGPAMALWYKGNYPWWKGTKLVPHSGLSLEEQRADPDSLWHFYQRAIALRKAEPVLATGGFRAVESDKKFVLAWVREGRGRQLLTVANLSGNPVTVQLDWREPIAGQTDLLTKTLVNIKPGNWGSWGLDLAPWEVKVIAK